MDKDDLGRFATIALPILSALAYIAYNNPATYRDNVIPWVLGIAGVAFVVLMTTYFTLDRARDHLREALASNSDSYIAALQALTSLMPNTIRWVLILWGGVMYAVLLLKFNKNLP
jgi:hypothetical protein